jgi:hypothetical protein
LPGRRIAKIDNSLSHHCREKVTGRSYGLVAVRGVWKRRGRVLLTLLMVAAALVHRRFGWIPVSYLAAYIGVPAVGWCIARRVAIPRLARWSASLTATLAFVMLTPVPWMQAAIDDPPGNAWRLDGRIVINGDTVDPPGTWYWLTVGRPPIVAEVVRGWFGDDAPHTMHAGRRASRPAYSEPAAAAVGLRRAGWPLDTRLVIEVSDPLDDLLPIQAIVSSVNGVEVATRDEWRFALDHLSSINTITTVNGDSYDFAGTELPFRRVELLEMPDDDELDVVVGGPLASTPAGAWWRNLSLGSSHGLMVALIAFAHGSGSDLAAGRTIAGTGRMLSDGSVGTIGGLRAKATAARDAGADVLLFPASQQDQLAGFDAGSMRLVPVTSLDAAIDALSA